MRHKTGETLGGITDAADVIDEAQKNISDLSGQVVSLQQILSDKQARGAFAQEQMESIVADGLPPDALRIPGHAYATATGPTASSAFPATRRCIVMDAKFPLEGFEPAAQRGQ